MSAGRKGKGHGCSARLLISWFLVGDLVFQLRCNIALFCRVFRAPSFLVLSLALAFRLVESYCILQCVVGFRHVPRSLQKAEQNIKGSALVACPDTC